MFPGNEKGPPTYRPAGLLRALRPLHRSVAGRGGRPPYFASAESYAGVLCLRVVRDTEPALLHELLRRIGRRDEGQRIEPQIGIFKLRYEMMVCQLCFNDEGIDVEVFRHFFPQIFIAVIVPHSFPDQVDGTQQFCGKGPLRFLAGGFIGGCGQNGVVLRCDDGVADEP